VKIKKTKMIFSQAP